MEQTNLEGPAASKKHDPLLCALSHILIFGGPYLYLRLYRRFFAAMGLIVASAFVPVVRLGVLVLLAAMVDTYRQAKAINEGTVQKEPFDNTKHVGGTILVIVLVLASLLGILPVFGSR